MWPVRGVVLSRGFVHKSGTMKSLAVSASWTVSLPLGSADIGVQEGEEHNGSIYCVKALIYTHCLGV